MSRYAVTVVLPLSWIGAERRLDHSPSPSAPLVERGISLVDQSRSPSWASCSPANSLHDLRVAVELAWPIPRISSRPQHDVVRPCLGISQGSLDARCHRPHHSKALHDLRAVETVHAVHVPRSRRAGPSHVVIHVGEEVDAERESLHRPPRLLKEGTEIGREAGELADAREGGNPAVAGAAGARSPRPGC